MREAVAGSYPLLFYQFPSLPHHVLMPSSSYYDEDSGRERRGYRDEDEPSHHSGYALPPAHSHLRCSIHFLPSPSSCSRARRIFQRVLPTVGAAAPRDGATAPSGTSTTTRTPVHLGASPAQPHSSFLPHSSNTTALPAPCFSASPPFVLSHISHHDGEVEKEKEKPHAPSSSRSAAPAAAPAVSIAPPRAAPPPSLIDLMDGPLPTAAPARVAAPQADFGDFNPRGAAAPAAQGTWSVVSRLRVWLRCDCGLNVTYFLCCQGLVSHASHIAASFADFGDFSSAPATQSADAFGAFQGYAITSLRNLTFLVPPHTLRPQSQRHSCHRLLWHPPRPQQRR
jgi:hypothetical protein